MALVVHAFYVNKPPIPISRTLYYPSFNSLKEKEKNFKHANSMHSSYIKSLKSLLKAFQVLKWI